MIHSQIILSSHIRPQSLLFWIRLTALVLTFSSCKKFIEIPPPPNEVVTATVFSDSTAASSAMTGLYSQMMSSNLFFANGGVTVFAALSADELTRAVPNPLFDVFTANEIPSNNGPLQNNLWRAAYAYIYHCNAIIEGANQSSALSTSFKQRLTAEARFNRAFCYFYLINLFGDVPLVTATDYTVNASMPRTSTVTIYQTIDADLAFAKQYLPAAFPDNAQPTSGAATAMLARSKLYQKDWATAEANATVVISSGLYSLPADLNEVFNTTSSETIWQLVPVLPSFNTAEGNAFIPASPTSRPTYVLTPTQLNVFDSSDERKTAWTKTVVLNSEPYTFPFKYKQRVRLVAGAPPTEYNIVLRLAEQYFIRAEARAKQGKMNEAVTDLNAIRSRAGLPDTVVTDEPSLLLSIEKERQRELFAEGGHRWLDLKRTNRADAALASLKPTWQPTDVLYPIPFGEIQANPALTQNSGY